jgi:hypothetical protein
VNFNQINMTEVSFLHVFTASLIAETLRNTVLNPAETMKQVIKAVAGEQGSQDVNPMA